MPSDTRLTRLSEHLFQFSDTCNVYIVRNGDKAILIDFGAGDVLQALPDIGVSQVDWILHTHHHRDQAQGDHLAVEQGIPIAVPEHEAYFFREAEHFWRSKRIHDSLNQRSTFLSLTSDIPVAQELKDYSHLEWGPYRFFVFPTPGHTLGSSTLVCEIDSKLVAFTGDLIHSAGKPVSLHSLQYLYASLDGIDVAAYSIDSLRKKRPELLCPSHGDPMMDADAALAETSQALKDWFNFQSQFDTFPMTHNNRLVEITPHLIGYPGGLSAFYVLLSESGKALFIDYGVPGGYHYLLNMNHFEPGERLRFVEHSLDELRDVYGLRSIDVAMPTHYHNDHLAGFPFLQRQFGTQIWAYENMVDIMERPSAHNITGMLMNPMKVDRTISDGETVVWEEYELTVIHSPGHSEYHCTIFAEVDGKKCAFTGDNFFHWTDDPILTHQIIYRNQARPGNHLKTARRLLDYKPDIMCPGHGSHYDASLADLEGLVVKMTKLQEKLTSLASDPEAPTLSMDPDWAHVYPYQSNANPGESFDVEVRIRNHYLKPVEAKVTLALPSGWTCTPEKQTISIPAGDTVTPTSVGFTIHIPSDYVPRYSRVAYAADITMDGNRHGQVAEGLVWVAEAY